MSIFNKGKSALELINVAIGQLRNELNFLEELERKEHSGSTIMVGNIWTLEKHMKLATLQHLYYIRGHCSENKE